MRKVKPKIGISKEQRERDNEAFRKEHTENRQKVIDAGLIVGQKTGSEGKYYYHEGRAYESHFEAVQDIVKRYGL